MVKGTFQFDLVQNVGLNVDSPSYGLRVCAVPETIGCPVRNFNDENGLHDLELSPQQCTTHDSLPIWLRPRSSVVGGRKLTDGRERESKRQRETKKPRQIN